MLRRCMFKKMIENNSFRESSVMRDFIAQDTGAAAIEFAFILPLMLLLYFGLVDVTGLISLNRRVVSAAATMADLVGQQKTTVLKSTITDQFNAVYVIMQPVTSANVRVEVFDYRSVSGTITQIWKTSNNSGPACGAAPVTTNMATLMTAGNDLIVARTCAVFSPAVATFGGTTILGATTISLKQAISVRPRSSLTLTCYATVVGGALCT